MVLVCRSAFPHRTQKPSWHTPILSLSHSFTEHKHKFFLCAREHNCITGVLLRNAPQTRARAQSKTKVTQDAPAIIVPIKIAPYIYNIIRLGFALLYAEPPESSVWLVVWQIFNGSLPVLCTAVARIYGIQAGVFVCYGCVLERVLGWRQCCVRERESERDPREFVGIVGNAVYLLEDIRGAALHQFAGDVQNESVKLNCAHLLSALKPC